MVQARRSWFRLERAGDLLHQPSKTHRIIKLIRLLIENKSKKSVVITETNIPNIENLSYFGDQDEAHLIYNFLLPPLLLNTLITGDYSQLKRWIMTMPPARGGDRIF